MSPNKRKRDDMIRTDEVATDYKLQQFLEDVQKFTERSKKNEEKQKRNRKPEHSKQLTHKRGLFENGFRSKPFLKETKARLKSDLNDLVKECAKTVENEEENLSSNSQSIFEGSFEIGNKEVDNNNIDVVPEGNEKTVYESERLPGSEAPHNASNSPLTIIKDRNQLKELVWQKYCERMKSTQSLAKIFPVVDHFKIAQQRINEMIYRTFLRHAKQYPTILKRIFSNDEIKTLAQVVVKDKVDKYQQTEDIAISHSISSNIQCEMSTKKDSILNFPHPSQNSCDNQKEAGNFFALNLPKKTNTQVNFLQSLENQPDIYSPGVQITSPDCNVTPPPSPLPINIQDCWAPSTLSTPRKPEIFSPNISTLQHCYQEPLFLPPEPHVVNQCKASFMLGSNKGGGWNDIEPNLLRKKRRKKTSQMQFVQNTNILSSPQLCFPKRKRLAYSPHRL